MTREEIVEKFRTENPDITKNVISDTLLYDWCLTADKEICAATRCITDQNGTTITTAEDDSYYDLTDKIDKFYDIDDFPGSGVLYNSKRIEKTTMAKLDEDYPNWRSRSSGTPREWYRRGQWLYLDRPIDSKEYNIKVYSVLISDDFDDDDITPFNQLSFLEPFHDGINKYLQWRGKQKKGNDNEAMIAKQDYMDYIAWMRKTIGGNKFGPIYFQPKR